MDIFTRYIITVPLKTKKAKEVAEALFVRVFAIEGRPRRIQTDQGTKFVKLSSYGENPVAEHTDALYTNVAAGRYVVHAPPYAVANAAMQ